MKERQAQILANEVIQANPNMDKKDIKRELDKAREMVSRN